MSRPEFDLSRGLQALDDQLKDAANSHTEIKAQWKAFRDTLTPEQLEAFWVIQRDTEHREYAIGARRMIHFLQDEGLLTRDEALTVRQSMKRLNDAQLTELRSLRANMTRERERNAPLRKENAELKEEVRELRRERMELRARFGKRERVANQVANLTDRLARKDALVNRLRREIKDAAVWAEIQAAHADALPEEAPAPEPQWTPPTPPRRRVARDEVLTDAPFGVEVVARQVEEFVRRQGKCSKPDVSAAFPDERALLPTVYRHLHESRKVQVTGWTLTPWPTP